MLSPKLKINLLAVSLLFAALSLLHLFSPGPFRWPEHSRPFAFPETRAKAAPLQAILTPAETGGSMQVPFYRDGVIVLMYHQLDTTPRPRGVISPALFAAQMRYLKENDFHPISLAQMHAFLRGEAQVPARAVMITFDDGYENVYRYAYPILKQEGFPATVFVIVGATESKRSQIPHLTWAEMREMSASGLIAIQSHTYLSHAYAPLTADGKTGPLLANPIYLPEKKRRETMEEYKQRITADLRRAKQTLEEKLGQPVTALAFPFGAFNTTVLKVARSLGYQDFFTIKSGINRPEINKNTSVEPFFLVRRISAGDVYMTTTNLNRYLTLAAQYDGIASALFKATLSPMRSPKIQVAPQPPRAHPPSKK